MSSYARQLAPAIVHSLRNHPSHSGHPAIAYKFATLQHSNAAPFRQKSFTVHKYTSLQAFRDRYEQNRPTSHV